MGFRPLQASKTTTVGTAGTDRIALDFSAGISNTLRVVNTGAAIVYCAFGDSTVTAAVATSHPVLPNSYQDLEPPSDATHMAMDSAAGSLVVITTEGLSND